MDEQHGALSPDSSKQKNSKTMNTERKDQSRWLIYGANGYTGDLIAREAARRGLTPVLAGRSRASIESLAAELGLESRVFALDDHQAIVHALRDVTVVLHCAGPFSATCAPMIQACLEAKTHYLDVSGEISVFEYAHGQVVEARRAGVVLCPGVGFDVIPTDCVAAALKEALPDAVSLSLGFDSRSTFSPGTAKTAIEGFAQGGRVRKRGEIVVVPLAYRQRQIDFGNGAKAAVTVQWGDVSTAFHTTGIPNIEVYIAMPPSRISQMRRLNFVRPLLGISFVRRALQRYVGAKIKGPSQAKRDAAPTYVWGEAVNARGERRTARIKTANGYSVTVTGSLEVVRHLLDRPSQVGGAYTPSMLVGIDLVTRLPDSSSLVIE